MPMMAVGCARGDAAPDLRCFKLARVLPTHAAAAAATSHAHCLASLNWLAAFSYMSAASSYLLPPKNEKALSRLSALSAHSRALAP